MTANSQPAVNEYRLNEDNELRLELSNDDVVIELLDGTAELFGTSLTRHKRYTLPGGFRGAIFTYQGAVIEVIGKTESAYIAQQTPMIIYLNTHVALEALRENAEMLLNQDSNSTVRGPRLMVAGPTDVGKSTLCRILCNYAIRQSRTPIFVDLDIGQGSISIPGTIGALYIEKPADIVDGFDKNSACVFSFGHLSPSVNLLLYKTLITELSNVVKRKCKQQKASNVGGLIINTCGWVKGEGYDCIVHAAEAFEVDVVIVLDHERLFVELQHDLPSFVKILHQPKSGGVEGRSREIRASSRRNVIHRYFYGIRSDQYYPHTFELSFDKPTDEQELIVAKFGAEELPESCLPFGMELEEHRTKVVKVPITSEIKNHVLALMPPSANKVDQSLLSKPIHGFIVITNVDMEKKILTVLSPQPYPLPSKIALLSEITFIDDETV